MEQLSQETLKVKPSFALEMLQTLDENIPVILCVGTFNLVDSVGVRVAEILKKVYKVPCYVYGGVNEPVDQSNIESYMSYISRFHKGRVYVVDSALCSLPSKVGTYSFSQGNTHIALGKHKYGDYSIKAYVGTYGKHLNILVPLTLYSVVENMSEKIAYDIYRAVVLKEDFLTLGLNNVKC